MARHNRPFPRMSHGPMGVLRAFRISRSWTQAELAERAGVRQNVISSVELGRVVPDMDLRGKIASVFGVPAAEIFPELTKGTEEEPS